MYIPFLTWLYHLPAYNFFSFNCFHLAQSIRNYYQVESLPDCSKLHRQYHSDIVSEYLELYCDEFTGVLKHLDLVCLRAGSEAILGTVLIFPGISDSKIVYFSPGNVATCQTFRLLADIESIWTYPKLFGG